ncbi:MAG: DUF1934 domain-containing protein [Sarcina sp.]
MENNAVIKVSSVQLSNDNEQIEVISNGIFKAIEDGYEVSYEETEISGMEGTVTKITVTEDKVILERIGTTESLIEFKIDSNHVSLYNTPYGMLELLTKTKVLDIDVTEKGGVVKIDYEMSVAGQKPINTNLNLAITIK